MQVVRHITKKGVRVNGQWFLSPALGCFFGDIVIDIPDESPVDRLTGTVNDVEIELFASTGAK